MHPILSIRQPWAWAIVHGAGKKVENRTWRTRYRGWFWIHASATPDVADAWGFVANHCEAPTSDNTILGAIIGRARLVDCVDYPKNSDRQRRLFSGMSPVQSTLRDDPWAFGPVCWILADARPILNPIPCRGRLGLWTPGVVLFGKLPPIV